MLVEIYRTALTSLRAVDVPRERAEVTRLSLTVLAQVVKYGVAVGEGADRWQSPVTYEIEVDRAATDRVGELGSSAISVSGEESLEWSDALDVLRSLDGYDARQVYAGAGDRDEDDAAEAGAAQSAMIVDAVVAFLEQRRGA